MRQRFGGRECQLRPKMVKIGWVRLCEKDLRLSFCLGVVWGLQLLDRLAPPTFQKVATFSLLVVDLTQLRNIGCYWAAAQQCSNSLHLTNRPTSSLVALDESQPNFKCLPLIFFFSSYFWYFSAQHVFRHRFTKIVALAGEHPPAPKVSALIRANQWWPLVHASSRGRLSIDVPNFTICFVGAWERRGFSFGSYVAGPLPHCGSYLLLELSI